MLSILSVGMNLEARSVLTLISRGIHVVTVSNIAHAAPIFQSTLFNAVILGYSVTQSMSKRELRTFVRDFGDSLVLVSGNAISADQKSLVQISPNKDEIDRSGKPVRLMSDLQELFQSKTAVSVSLQSWKEISEYMNRGIRTLQRWEKKYGLPIHRPSARDRSAVFALTAEIDEWMRNTHTNHVTETTRDESAAA
jgi:hypothetical protein